MRLHPDTIREAEDAVADALRDYVGSGEVTEDEALDLVVALLDAALPMRALLPGLAGEVAEVASDKAIKAAVKKLAEVLKPDPDRLLKRAQRASARGRYRRAAILRTKAAALKGDG